MNRILLACTVLLIAHGCSKPPAGDVMDTRQRPAAGREDHEPARSNADGVRCDVKTCKADAASDCATFKDRCQQSNHTYSGDNDSGTCTRGDGVG